MLNQNLKIYFPIAPFACLNFTLFILYHKKQFIFKLLEDMNCLLLVVLQTVKFLGCPRGHTFNSHLQNVLAVAKTPNLYSTLY
jgi:hypothetical protein